MYSSTPIAKWVLINGQIINVQNIDLVTQASDTQCAILFQRAESMYRVECSVEELWKALAQTQE
jgi:hypothetical protein